MEQQNEIESLQARIKALETALKIYGKHDSNCSYTNYVVSEYPDPYVNSECNCGFGEILSGKEVRH